VDLVAEELDLEGVEDEMPGSPDVDLVHGERRRALEAAVKALDPRDQLLITLRFDVGLAVRKIAPMMGYPTPFHVYRRLNASLETLRRALVARGITGP
jgi:DNA-directed RNA polymerase specialized sigma subunit